MTSYLVDLLKLFWTGYGLIFLCVLAAVIAFAPSRETKIGGTLVLLLMAAWPVWLYLEAKQQEARLIKRNQAMWAHFEKRCKEDARITIKRVVENVDGVLIMKPRKVATEAELQDQFWMGDPYGYSRSEAARPNILLSYADRGRYSFIEYPNPDDRIDGAALAFVRLEGYGLDQNGDYQYSKKTMTGNRKSKFGFDWDDISTPEDRAYWIAGGRMRIVDLETKEVIAEKVGYLVDPLQGGRVGGSTWHFSNSKSCPQQVDEYFKTREFLYQVLKPSPGVINGK
jgi:hypothetical protein